MLLRAIQLLRGKDMVISVRRVQGLSSSDFKYKGVPWDLWKSLEGSGAAVHTSLKRHRVRTHECNPAAIQKLSLEGFFLFFSLHRKQNLLQGETCPLLPPILHGTYTS